MGKIAVKNDREANQFTASLDGKKAFINYKKQDDGTLNLTHTEVPPEFEGKGVGSQLVKQALELVKADGGKIVPSCPFVANYIHRHSEYQELIKK